MKRILVTGAAGFVGLHLLDALAAAQPSSRIVGIGRGAPQALPPGVTFQSVDLLDGAGLSAAIAAFEPTDVLHLAALSSVQQSADAPTETWRTNVVGVINLADALARHAGAANVFFASSGEVYGRAFQSGLSMTEETAPEPVGTYARSKWFGEQILADVLPKAGHKLVIMRPFNHIGPGQDERFVVSSFAGQIARIEAGVVPPVLSVGNLDARRDFLAVGDVVRAYLALLDGADAIAGGSVFNIASGRPRSIASVLADLKRQARAPFEVRTAADRMRPSDIPLAAGDASRLTAATGWTPGEDWDTTLARILDAARCTVSWPNRSCIDPDGGVSRVWKN